MKRIASFTAAAAASIAAFGFAAPAAAQDDVVSAEVDVTGLDPARDGAEIDRRIAQAARRVCGHPDSRTVTAIARVESCRATATSHARGR